MAPKKPPDKKPEKAEPPKADKAETEPGLVTGELTQLEERVKKFFESSYSLYVGAVLVIVSIVGASMLTYLYVKEVQRRAIFEEGTKTILRYIEDTFPDLFDADDITKIKKAENISVAISEEKKKISEIKQAIRDIQHRLREEWVVWHGALYLYDFIATPRPWKKCIQYCERMKYDTKLICIEDESEQAQVSSIVTPRPNDYYIGVSMVGSEWRCYQKEFIIRNLYWDSRHPRTETDKVTGKLIPRNCVIVTRNCPHSFNCWYNVPCQDLKRCLCKMKPMAKWMK